MGCRTSQFVFAVMLIAAGFWQATSASAQTQQQLNWCKGNDGATPDLRIGGCTAVIQSGKYSGKNLSFAFVNRGLAYRAKGDNDRAITDYNMAIRLDPNDATAFMDRGNAYKRKGELDRALADYNESIRLMPKNADGFYNRGLAYYEKKDYDRDIADQTRAIALGPSTNAEVAGNDTFTKLSPNRTVADYYGERGLAYYAKQDNARALADYNRAISLDSDNSYRYNNRGNAYKSMGELDRAIADYDQAIKLRPKYWLALRNRGNALYLAGKYDLAIADYDSISQIDPKAADGLYGRGIAKLKKGDSAGGNADIAAAKVVEADIAEQFGRLGVK